MIYDLTRLNEISPSEPINIIGVLLIPTTSFWSRARIWGTHLGITTEDIMNLSDRGKLVLLGLVRALKNQKRAYVGLKEIRDGYEIACEELGVKPTGEIEDYVQDLIDRGIVSMKSLREFGISDVPAEDLERFLNGLVERLKVGQDET